MLYQSTRGGLDGVTSAEAIRKGLAPDGGLFVPESAVRLLPEEIYSLSGMNYRERAVFILERFLGDYSRKELAACVNAAYGSNKFEGDGVAPVRKLNNIAYKMELWYTEEQTGGLRFSCQVKQALATVRTPYQHLAVLDTETFGPMLVLDGMVMTTISASIFIIRVIKRLSPI